MLAALVVLALTAAPPPPGTVVAHSPSASRQYIGSPSILKLPSGELLASHDFFGPGTNFDTMRVYASADAGKSWVLRAELKGQWWSNLFLHGGAAWLFGTSKEYGHVVLRKSTDAGKTWTQPRDAKTGRLRADGMFHCAPVPVVEHNGRVWRAFERYTGPKWGTFEPFVMSAPATADLLDAAAWTSTEPLKRDPAWLNGAFASWLEGNFVVGPDGQLWDILRVHQPNYPELAAFVRVAADGTRCSFDPAKDFAPFPGGGKKFTVRYDAKSKKYWSLVNDVPAEYRKEKPRPDQTRNTLALAASRDLRTWEVQKVLLQHPDALKHGFQYADWIIDGDDILAAVRTAWDEADGQAHSAHDANYLTFLRVPNFRTESR